MRTSLFSILGPLEGLRFLDLFSGSGLVGLEAASRGAGPIDLVELDMKKKTVIQRNLSWAEEPIRLHMSDVRQFLRKAEETWDIIYLDPPFPLLAKQSLLETIDQRQLLVPQGSLILHYPGEETLPAQIGALRQYDHRTYGRSHLVFFTRDLPDLGDKG